MARKPATKTTAQADYLAIIPIGGGSSWGRSPDKDAAVQNAIRSLRDWDSLFDVSGIEITVNVVDVQGYSDCSWGGHPGGYMYGKNEETGLDEPVKRPFEKVKVVTPKWKRRK